MTLACPASSVPRNGHAESFWYRSQSTLFPQYLEDWIGEDNPVRVIDAFVEELDLAELGFDGVDPEATGRPSYHPSVLLNPPRKGAMTMTMNEENLTVPPAPLPPRFSENDRHQHDHSGPRGSASRAVHGIQDCWAAAWDKVLKQL